MTEHETQETAKSATSGGEPRFIPLRIKLGRLVFSVFVLVAVATLWATSTLYLKTSENNLMRLATHIDGNLAAKGKALAQSHGLALRSLAVDNAFRDIQVLVQGAVDEDSDVVYGLFFNADGEA